MPARLIERGLPSTTAADRGGVAAARRGDGGPYARDAQRANGYAGRSPLGRICRGIWIVGLAWAAGSAWGAATSAQGTPAARGSPAAPGAPVAQAGTAAQPAPLARAAPASAEVPSIPLRVGLQIVTAVNSRDGDYESIKTLESVDSKAVRIHYSAEAPMVADDVSDEPPAPTKYRQYRPHPSDPNKWITILNVYRNVLRTDLDSADHYLQVFDEPPGEPETVPGTTAIGTSTRVLKALKAGSDSDFTVYLSVYESYPLTSADANAGDPSDTRFKGTLHRVESGTVGVPVIVNGRLVNLPAIHVKGMLLDEDAEFWFLDDINNPLTLRFTFYKDALKVVRINFPGESASMPGADGGSGIEQALSRTGRAITYGIFFGFNSDLIRPESEPVLREIAAMMTKHPDWTLDVDGHTDNIGGPSFNQTLSTRRANAVKSALVQRYHVAADRLQTAGYGLSQPRATNDTLEGRALNRRVELVKH